MLRFFLSGASGIDADILPRVAAVTDCRLLSMHARSRSNARLWFSLTHHEQSAMKEIMLDSGAFTAFTLGDKVELDDLVAMYTEALSKINKRCQVWLINLDVIPGEYGRVSTAQEIADALTQSDANFRKLRKRFGSRVLPVFHQTESEARLHDVVAMNDFVAMGFRQDFAEEHRIRCAEEALTYAHSRGVLVHGLATTGARMLARAPFDTVDSASWTMAAAMGNVSYIDESGKLAGIPVSLESPAQRLVRGHYNTLTPDEQRWIDARMRDAGSSIEAVQRSLSHRLLVNAHQLREWVRAMPRPALRSQPGLFPL